LEELSYQGPLIARCEGYGEAGLVIAKECYEVIIGKGKLDR
jgi:hypothetical protein